jgi:hypothetical protein
MFPYTLKLFHYFSSEILLHSLYQLNVIPEKSYIHVAGLLVEASKMNAAWLKNTEERIAKTTENPTKNSLF